MTQFVTPAGRLVQGGVTMQHQKDMDTNKPLFNDDGTPQMGIFLALAFPKLVNGQANPEFAAFWTTVVQEAATAWASLFPNGAAGGCSNPRFSWKYQDGDGVDHNGKSVAGKAGFAGHHIVKFYTAYPIRCFKEGEFSPHQELQQPAEVIKRGDWIRVVGDVRSNNATGTQVPGMSLYPNLISFIGQDPAGRINSGPDAATAFATPAGYVPAGVSAHPAGAGVGAPPAGAPGVSVPGVSVPGVSVPGVSVPGVSVPGVAGAGVIPPPPGAGVIPAAQPTYVVAPQFAAQGITVEGVLSQGWTLESAAAQGYLVKQ